MIYCIKFEVISANSITITVFMAVTPWWAGRNFTPI